MKTTIINDTLNEMSRDELAAVAKQLNIPVGKSKSNTVSNVAAAIAKGNARFTVQFSIREKGVDGAVTAPTIYSKKLRTHKPDKIVQSPVASSN